MSAVTSVLDYFTPIAFLKMAIVEVFFIASKENDLLFVLFQTGSFSAQSLHFSENNPIQFFFAFYFLLL
jgi:hypothetical protein